MEEHDIKDVVAWLGQDPYHVAGGDEHELYANIKDCGLKATQAFLPNTYLPYLANTRYGRKEAIKAYKQYVLSAVEYGISLLIMDALPVGEGYMQAMQELCAYAKEQGVMLCVRDVASADMIGLLSRVPDLYYCLDTAACLKNGYDIQERIDALQDRLMAVVLADLALDDTRLLPGSGKTDFAPILKALSDTGYQGLLTVHAQKAANLDADGFLDAVKALA